jgi:hypothetical protein
MGNKPVVPARVEWHSGAVKRYEAGGGNGGYYFNKYFNSQVTSITIRHSWYIDSIQFSNKNEWSPPYGGTGGQQSTFYLDKDEKIHTIRIAYGTYVDGIEITTNRNRIVQYGGSGGTKVLQYKMAANEYVVGFHGNAANLVDKLGVITRTY